MVAPSSGASTKTRLRVTPEELVLLREVGAHLTAMRVADLRAAMAGEKQSPRAKRLAAEYGVPGRYAETACVDNDAAVKAARECRRNRRSGLRSAIATLERRTAAPSRRRCGCGQRAGCETCKAGYATENDRIQKRRRLDVLRGELARVERQLAAKRYPVVLGTRRLLTTRHHLARAQIDEAGWRARWEQQRSWFGAIGNTGKPGGNPCLTLTLGADGRLYLTVSVPRPVAQRLGVATRFRLEHPVEVTFLGEELRDRVEQRRTTRLDIEFTADRRGRSKVYLRSSWQRTPAPAATLLSARAAGVVGVDFNADHFAAWRLDVHGNPVGQPLRVSLELAGQPSRVRDGRLRQALTATIDHAVVTGASAIVVEDLGFTDAEKSREAYGRKKAFRHLVSGFATSQVKDRLPRMAAKAGLAVIAVDPRYTSRFGGASWQQMLTSPTRVVTRHEGAAVAIGRRGQGLGLTARRKARLPRTRSVPHQSDGSTTGLTGQGRAPAHAARSNEAAGDHLRAMQHTRPPRRPPGPGSMSRTGVAASGRAGSRSKAGHRFPGTSPER